MAQAFHELSTADDGATLYFSSSIRQKGADQSFHSKIFRWDEASGVRVVADVRNTGESDGCTTAEFYQLRAPQISGDGAVLAYAASRPGAGSSLCSPLDESTQTVIQGFGREQKLNGKGAISPNGQYAITIPTPAAVNNFHFVTNLTTGVSLPIAGAFDGSGQRVSDEATVVTPSRGAVILTGRNGCTRVLPTTWPVSDAVIDRSGRTVVYLTELQPSRPAGIIPGRITSIDVASGRETQVASDLFAPRNLMVARDGVTVFFLDSIPSGFLDQLYVARIGDSGVRRITSEKDRINSAIVSGSGLVAYAITSEARLLKIDVSSTISTELPLSAAEISAAARVYPTNEGSSATTVAAIGSMMRLVGWGFDALKELSLCGRQLPVTTSARRFEVSFQVPWDLLEGPCQVLVESGSGFESAIDLDVRTFDPQFVAGMLLHENHAGQVTSTNPARPGETIIAYMTGLGPVDQDGQVTSGFECRFDSGQAVVSSAGLAPDLPGLYYVNVTIPAPSSSASSLVCGWHTPRLVAATPIWLRPS